MNVYLLELARELGSRGYLVDIYTRRHDPNDPQTVTLAENARVVHLQAGPHQEPKEGLYDYIPEFLDSLRAFQHSEGLSYDLVHSHYWLSGWAGTFMAREWGVPHVTTFHTLGKTKLQARAGEREPQVRMDTEARVMEEADAIVVSTVQEAEDIARLYHVPSHKVEVVSAGVNLSLFRPRDKGEARKALGLTDRRIILYVGRIEPLKGLDILIQATALLEDASDTRLVVVGGIPGKDRELERMRAMARGLGLADLVTFTGAVAHDELPDYYSAADVFALPSYHESFGLVALEAMACGTPVVASRVGGLTSFIGDGVTGYLVPRRCPEPFAQRLEILLSNESLRGSMGRAARAKAEGMSWAVVADGLVGVYSTLTERASEGLPGA